MSQIRKPEEIHFNQTYMSVPCSSEEFVPWRGGTGVNETGRFAFCYVTQEKTGEADTPTKLITSLNLQLDWKPSVAHFGVIPAVTWSETQLWVNLSSWWRARNLNRMIPVVWLQARKQQDSIGTWTSTPCRPDDQPCVIHAERALHVLLWFLMWLWLVTLALLHLNSSVLFIGKSIT